MSSHVTLGGMSERFCRGRLMTCRWDLRPGSPGASGVCRGAGAAGGVLEAGVHTPPHGREAPAPWDVGHQRGVRRGTEDVTAGSKERVWGGGTGRNPSGDAAAETRVGGPENAWGRVPGRPPGGSVGSRPGDFVMRDTICLLRVGAPSCPRSPLSGGPQSSSVHFTAWRASWVPPAPAPEGQRPSL